MLQANLEGLEDQIKEVKIGNGDDVEFVKVEDRDFDKKREPALKVEELVPEQLAEIRDGFSLLPVNIGGPNAHRAIVRFLNVEGSTKKDLVIILGPEEGRTISIDDKKAVGVATSTVETPDLGPARRTSFRPKEQLKFGKREINEVRIFVGTKNPEGMPVKPDTAKKPVSPKKTTAPESPKKEPTEQKTEDTAAKKEMMDYFFPELILGADPDDPEAVRKEKLDEEIAKRVKAGNYFEKAKIEGLAPASAYDSIQEEIKFYTEQKTKKPWDNFNKEHLERLQKIATYMEKFRPKK